MCASSPQSPRIDPARAAAGSQQNQPACRCSKKHAMRHAPQIPELPQTRAGALSCAASFQPKPHGPEALVALAGRPGTQQGDTETIPSLLARLHKARRLLVDGVQCDGLSGAHNQESQMLAINAPKSAAIDRDKTQMTQFTSPALL